MTKAVKRFRRSAVCLVAAIVIACILRAIAPQPDSYFRDRAVKIQSPRGSCSGEQIAAPSGVNYILTAAHCRALMDDANNFEVKTESGKVMKRRFVAEDPNSDILLIEGLPGVRGLKIAPFQAARQHVRTYTSGHGFLTYRTEGALVEYQEAMFPVRLIESDADHAYCSSMSKYRMVEDMFGQRLCVLDIIEMTSTAHIVPGSSGGMVVDDNDALVGVVSATDTQFSYFVSLRDIRAFTGNY